jgi:hypothetical protein
MKYSTIHGRLLTSTRLQYYWQAQLPMKFRVKTHSDRPRTNQCQYRCKLSACSPLRHSHVCWPLRSLDVHHGSLFSCFPFSSLRLHPDSDILLVLFGSILHLDTIVVPVTPPNPYFKHVSVRDALYSHSLFSTLIVVYSLSLIFP